MAEFYTISTTVNAMHDTGTGCHAHTFKMQFLLRRTGDSFQNYTIYENIIEEGVADYKGAYLNELPEFKDMQPTVENLCTCVYKRAKELFDNNDNYDLVRVSVGDSPTRSVSVSDTVNIMAVHRILSLEETKRLLETSHE